jgi:MoaA/NifB/PqqE/SkfB family radical SAM enzyme
MVMATNGTLVTDETARRMLASGIKRVSVSIDGPDAESHDAFRCVPGAFEGALAGIEAMKRAGMPFQINTTITRANLPSIGAIHDMVLGLGAAAHHIFLLVPTGRGREMSEQALSPQDYERTLEWFYERSLSCAMELKATCAPHYYRIFHQKGGNRREGSAIQTGTGHPLNTMTRGCLGGIAFCFISHTGQVQPCGYLEIDCGQIKANRFEDIWKTSTVFQELRDLSCYKGKCGRCELIGYAAAVAPGPMKRTGDYLEEEPLCAYEPKNRSHTGGRH